MSSHLKEAWPPSNKIKSCTHEKDLSTVGFFVGPPREIGELACADGTLSKREPGRQLLVYVMLVSGLLVAVSLFFFSLVPSVYVLVIGSGLCALLVAAIVLTEKIYCYFIGEVGVCESSAKLYMPGKPKTKTLQFDKAAALFVTKRHQYTNGIYAGTSYKFVWIQQDKAKFVVSGMYFGEKRKRGERDKYYYAEAAESAWTNHLLKIVDEEFEEKEYVDFPMCEKPWQNKVQTIRMRKGSLEFFPKKGDSQIVEIRDFKQASLQDGFITFKHKDAQWWSGSGSFSFSYSLVPNAHLFLICLDRIAGF